jgi:tRNA pseudouridine32 synthase/23S rRNA pseudouridine746 synthase
LGRVAIKLVSTEDKAPSSTLWDHPPVSWVLWVDEAVVAVNKPSGLRTLPDGYNPQAPHLKSLLEPVYGRLWIVHRLDKETSGVVVMARTAAAHRSLNTQFEQHTARKIYHALVRGTPEWEEKSIDLPLCSNGDRRHRTVVDLQQGKPALTNLRVVERCRDHTLVEARPETGRTHQIRAHLSALGFPLAGDGLYGGGAPVPPLESFALHAKSLSLKHPFSAELLKFEAPYPTALSSVLAGLRFPAAPEPLSLDP